MDAYSLAMEQLRNVKTVVKPVVAIRDGMGLSGREMAADSVGSEIGNKQHFGLPKPAPSGSQCSDSFAAPLQKRPAGRPSTSRQKAP